MALANALLAAKEKLKKTEGPTEPDPKALQTRAGDFLGFLKDEEELEKIRKVTGISTEQQRTDYFLNSGVDAWFDEMKENLAKSSSGVNNIDDVTFPTSVVDFSRTEKVALFDLFKAVFGDGTSRSCQVLEEGVERVRRIIAGTASAADQDVGKDKGRPLDFDWQPLVARLDEAVQRHGGSAFVKLSTRSPKDSFAALMKSRLVWESKASSKQRMADASLDHNDLWVQFSERLRLHLCARSGAEALLLLATSLRVWEDLDSDVMATDNGTAGSEKAGIQIIVRTFDEAVTPATEFRGFVWGGEFTCCAQYFYQMHFPGLEEHRQEIAEDLQSFYNRLVKPCIPNFISRQCPCFMMDLVWKKDCSGQSNSSSSSKSKVMLTEINPFDGEAVGTFPASTGLYLWASEADRKQIMGELGSFEVRLRSEPLMTAENLRTHPALRNLSPLWQCGIYGGE